MRCMRAAGLAENRCLARRPNGAQLVQVGEQEIALGAKFRARIVLDVEARHHDFLLRPCMVSWRTINLCPWLALYGCARGRLYCSCSS